MRGGCSAVAPFSAGFDGREIAESSVAVAKEKCVLDAAASLQVESVFHEKFTGEGCQREGIAKAKAAGKYKGRAPTARVKAPEVKRLREAGVGASEIARKLGIGRASVYRILDAEGV